ATDLPRKGPLTARGGDHFIDQRRRYSAKIPAAKIPFVPHQTADFFPIVAGDRPAHSLRNDRNFFQILSDPPVAVDVPFEPFPVVYSMLPGISRVAQDQPPFEVSEIAAEGFSPFATW